MPKQDLDPGQTLELLDDVVLGSARGRGRPGKLEVEVVRALVPADLDELRHPTPVENPNTALVQIKAAHHRLAMTIAEGHDLEIVSLMTGYSPSYVSKIKGDPAFAELLAYYQTQKRQVFVDTAERMKTLGLTTLDELQSRLETEGEKWSKRELMDLAELMLGKGTSSGGDGGRGASGGSGPGVSVSVTFVGTHGQVSGPPPGPGPMLDVQAVEPGE